MTKRNQHRIEITLSDERLAALDEARGNEARASFIKRAMDGLINATVTANDLHAQLDAIAESSPGELGMSRSRARMEAVTGRRTFNVSAKPPVKPRPKRGKR